MSLLRDTTGLIVLLGSAVLLGVLVFGAMSMWRGASTRPSSVARKIIAETAMKAPTDAHMALIVAWKALCHAARQRIRP